MEPTVLSGAEAAEYVEFKRARREAEIALTLRRLVVDASRREFDRPAVRSACESVRRLGASGVLVSPVNVVQARKCLGAGARVVCLVGGTGESVPSVKRKEAKKALAQGAGELRLVLCYSALSGGNLSYLKREIRKVRRAAKCALTVSLEDRTLKEEQIALGVRAACEGGADGVCVRGERELVLLAVNSAAGKLYCDCSDVENAEQLASVLRAGAAHVVTRSAASIGEELEEEARRSAYIASKAEQPRA